MKVRELKIPGAWEITPAVHGDSRGLFFEWLTDRGFSGFAGHRLDVRQANCSVSSAGVLRGLHFAQLPPSQAKYVTCVSGSVFDVVVDIRLGSPTFGQWDSVLLAEYNPQREHTICATDPDLAIDWPLVDGVAASLSDRDAAAPGFQEVRASGLLPTWAETQKFIDGIRSA